MDGSQDPLIAPRHPSPDLDGNNSELDYAVNDTGSDIASDVGEAIEPRPGVFIILLTVAAGISGLLFGYDTGVISATLVSIGTSLSGRTLTSIDKSVITSSTALFALSISPFSSVLADQLGRKRVILMADILFMLGAGVQAYSHTVGTMIMGRCIIGAGVGAASFVVPLYIAEVAPAAYRGRLVTTNVLFITLGQAIAYIVGWAFSTFGNKETGWRWMVGLGALPAAFQGVLAMFMPETPRWLVKVGDPAEAKLVIQRVNGGAGVSTRDADMVVKEIEIEAREEQEARRARDGQGTMVRRIGAWQELLTEGKNRRALVISCLLQGLQQLCGFNSLMYFSATIFTMVGFKSPVLTSLTVALTNFVFTLLALGLIDRIGRRRILLFSIPFMVVGLLLAAVGFSFLTVASDEPFSSQAANSGSGAGIVLASIMIYVASYALGLGNVPWMQSELFPLSVRSLGSGVATMTNWTANFVIGLTFLPMMDSLTPSWTFVLYATICAVGLGFIWQIYPETAGLSLEEATGLLDSGWGVR